MKPAHIKNIMDSIDASGEGSVDYKEFIATCVKPSSILKTKVLDKFFKMLKPRRSDHTLTSK